MAKSKRVKLEVDLPDDAIQDDEPDKKPRRGSRLAWFASRLLVMLVLLAVLIVFAPTILSVSGAWKSVLKWTSPELAGKIDARSLSLAWWSPISVQNLSVRDEQGQPLADIALVRSQKTLLELATSYPDLGTFEITEPRATVVLRRDGSNIEDFLTKLPQDKSGGKHSAPVKIGLVLTRGTIELDDTIARRQWSLENVSVELAWTAAADQPKTGKLAASIKPFGGREGEAPAEPSAPRPMVGALRGEIAAEFSWQPGAGQNATMGAGQAELKASGLPTELLEGALARFVGDIRPQGAVTLDAGYVWTDDGRSQHLIVRQLAAPQLVVAAPGIVGHDQLAVAVSTGQADVLIAGDKLDIKQLELASNLVQLRGKGSAALGKLSESSDVEITGQIDLAELARQLPGALRLQQGTQLTSGVVQLSLGSQALPDGRRWQGWLKTDGIAATNAGRPIVFDRPLEIDFTIRQTPQGPAIDRLVGNASFLKIEGSGTPAEGTITADADLDKLVAELGRLIDWRDIQLAGTMGAQVRWKTGPDGNPWTVNADARVQNFVLAAEGLSPWREQDLQVGADLTGILAAAGLEEISRGRLSVVSASDRLEANFAGPVKGISMAAAWPLSFTVQGSLSTWMPRLQPVVSLAGWQFAGALDAKGAGRFSPAMVELGPTTIEVQQLEIAGPGLWVREPIVKLSTAGTWDQAKWALTLPATTLESTAIALRADEIHLLAGSQPAVTGLVDFRANPARLSEWIGDRNSPRTWQIGGELTGRIEIADRGAAHEATLTADLDKFALLTPQPPQPTGGAVRTTAASTAPNAAAWQPLWKETRLKLTAQAGYDPAAGKLSLGRGSVQTDWASLTLTGAISDLLTRCQADLTGEIAYDLALVEQKIKADLFPRGPQDDPRKQRSIDTLVLRGQEKRPLSLRGPLLAQSGPAGPAGQGATIDASSRGPSDRAGRTTLAQPPLIPDELVGEASLGWQAAQYVGLVAGPADFKAQLKQGIVYVGPLDIPVSDGRLTTAPRILLNEPVPSIVVDRGPLIQNVRITPEMCNQWLKYVAPLLADATEAEGKFSLGLDGASVPLLAPSDATVQGTLAIQTAQVGPGALAKQYLGMARQLKTLLNPTAAQGDNYGRWLVLPEHNVAFAVRDGVVSHDGLTMTAQNFVMTTKGHVRIADQAIDLTASIPIQDAWFKKEQKGLLTSLHGQSIPVKIAGTLSQPRLDGKALETFSKQFAGAAVQGLLDKGKQKVQGVLEGEAGKFFGGLEGVLGPKPKTPAPAPAPAPRP